MPVAAERPFSFIPSILERLGRRVLVAKIPAPITPITGVPLGKGFDSGALSTILSSISLFVSYLRTMPR